MYIPSYHTRTYCIVQNFQGTKLSWLGHHVSIRRKTLRLHQYNIHKCQNTLNFEVCGKTFTFQAKTTKKQEFWPLNIFYYMVSDLLSKKPAKFAFSYSIIQWHRKYVR